MSDKKDKILENAAPFLVIGMAIAFFICLLYLFFYVAIWGVLIGGILWLGTMAKNTLFPDKPVNKEQGRIIEHDDKK